MNFAHYYNILQQIEKPIAICRREDYDKEATTKYLKQVENFLIENEVQHNLKKKIFMILLSPLEILRCLDEDTNSLIKFCNWDNFYLQYSFSYIENRVCDEIKDVINRIENCGNDINRLIEVFKYAIRLSWQIDGCNNSFELVNIAKHSNNNCYFNITTTEKDYFTLEIIAVIHKVIA